MKIHDKLVRQKNAIFSGAVVLLIVVLLLIPTGFESLIDQQAARTKGLVTKTDNSNITQHGIVKTGTQLVTVEILRGQFKGRDVTATNELIGSMELDTMFRPGDKALVTLDLSMDNQEIVAANIIDHYRINLELILFLVFVGLLIFFAGWTGAKALLSFVFTALAIWKLLLPLFLKGYDPVLISLGIVSGLTGVIIFLIGGLNKRGVVAFLGGFSGILLTCLFSIIFGHAFHIHGAVRQFSETLLYSGFAHLNITKIFFSGIFLASAGAVMDVAMDISASMNEVKAKHPDISRRELIGSGFNVGRAIIGTMTTTLLLAYSGGYTAMLMVFIAQGTPVINVLNITYVSAEILHTLVGSFGLVMVAPLTAVIGGFLFNQSPASVERAESAPYEELVPETAQGD
jgi:uncharacterized membrane protein